MTHIQEDGKLWNNFAQTLLVEVSDDRVSNCRIIILLAFCLFALEYI